MSDHGFRVSQETGWVTSKRADGLCNKNDGKPTCDFVMNFGYAFKIELFMIQGHVMHPLKLSVIALAVAVVGCGKKPEPKVVQQIPDQIVTAPSVHAPPVPVIRTDEESRLTIIKDTGDGASKAFDLADKVAIKGAETLKSRCDVIYLIVALGEKGHLGFVGRDKGTPIDHQLELCSRDEFFTKHNTPFDDQKNTIKLEKFAQQYREEAKAKIERFKAAEVFYIPAAQAQLRHYDASLKGFRLSPSFPALEPIRKSAESKFVDAFSSPNALERWEFTPVYLAGTPLVMTSRSQNEAEDIEATISKRDEYYDARYVVRPIALTGNTFDEKGPEDGRRLENAYLYLKIEQVVLYTQYDSYKEPLFSSTKAR